MSCRRQQRSVYARVPSKYKFRTGLCPYTYTYSHANFHVWICISMALKLHALLPPSVAHMLLATVNTLTYNKRNSLKKFNSRYCVSGVTTSDWSWNNSASPETWLRLMPAAEILVHTCCWRSLNVSWNSPVTSLNISSIVDWGSLCCSWTFKSQVAALRFLWWSLRHWFTKMSSELSMCSGSFKMGEARCVVIGSSSPWNSYTWFLYTE